MDLRIAVPRLGLWLRLGSNALAVGRFLSVRRNNGNQEIPKEILFPERPATDQAIREGVDPTSIKSSPSHDTG